MKTKFSVTDVDSLHWYHILEDMTVDDMIKRLKREGETNIKMLIGTAFHSILENPPSDDISIAENDGFVFNINCDAEIILPQIREIRASKTYNVNGIECFVTGGVDGISGNVVYDHKLSFNPNPEYYFDSYQWRAYLDIYNADIFTYYIYHAKEIKDLKEIDIVDISKLSMYRYPEMENNLIEKFGELVDFIKNYVPELIKGE